MRLGDLLKVSVAGLSMLPRLLTPSPMLATPLLSGPDRSAEEGWQDHLQLRGQVGLSCGFPGLVEMTGGEKGGREDEEAQGKRQIAPGKKH